MGVVVFFLSGGNGSENLEQLHETLHVVAHVSLRVGNAVAHPGLIHERK
jgi:hypothetical protein